VTKGESLIICGDCNEAHTPAEPPAWDYSDPRVSAVCTNCDGVMVQIPTKQD